MPSHQALQPGQRCRVRLASAWHPSNGTEEGDILLCLESHTPSPRQHDRGGMSFLTQDGQVLHESDFMVLELEVWEG